MGQTKLFRLIIICSFILLIFLISSCSGYKDFFYKYIEDDDGYFIFNNHLYSVLVDDHEFEHLPKPVVKYLKRSHLVNNNRISETFYNYKGYVKTENFDFKKRYRVKDHSSGMESRFITKARSFPFINANALFNKTGKIDAKIFAKKIFNPKEDQSQAVDEICMLKYLSQMVWYPSAFLGENIHFEPCFVGGKEDENSVILLIKVDQYSVSGVLKFDSISYMPIRFEGNITNNMENKFQLTFFETNYSNYGEFDSYILPSECTAIIVNSVDEKVIVRMKLTDYKTVDYEMAFPDKKRRLKKN
jgi:hypothetical protein